MQSTLNLVMRAVPATPVLNRTVSNRVLLLDVVGRKSRRRYRIPVGYVATADGPLIGTAGRWRRNLRPGRQRGAAAHGMPWPPAPGSAPQWRPACLGRALPCPGPR